jgi:transposase
MIRPPRKEVIGMQIDEREALLDRAAKAGVAAEDVDLMRAVFDSYAYVTELIEQKNQTLSRLRTIIFGSRTESRANVLGPDNAPESTAPGTEPTPPADIPPESAAPAAAPGKERAKSRGHGRRPVEDYTAAARVPLQVAGLLPGDACPHCQTGTLYELNRPGRLIRFVGNAPVQATVYELQKLRCQGCGQLKTAEPPAEVADAPKYDPTVASSIGVFKYGAGVPFYRAERLQEYAGVPLAASTQWMLVAEAAGAYRPVYGELIRAAAQGDLLHNDDTTARILESMGQRREKALRDLDPAADESPAAPRGDPQRTGMFTTNILAESGSHRIALYFTGGRHAGENLNEVLRQRAAELPPPMQMCDALSRNYPAEFQTIVANCLVHARRKFIEVKDTFLEECTRVLDALAVVYAADAHARENHLTPRERLHHHQAVSGPVMESLRAWLDESIAERRVEPNSGLGQAIEYLRRYWHRLTLFLRNPGAPLDNNICERALKKAILHRKNALFYRSHRGAEVGDIHMSLIHTCELCGVNPFEYLTALQRHADAVEARPTDWMPWNHRDTLTVSAANG